MGASDSVFITWLAKDLFVEDGLDWCQTPRDVGEVCRVEFAPFPGSVGTLKVIFCKFKRFGDVVGALVNSSVNKSSFANLFEFWIGFTLIDTLLSILDDSPNWILEIIFLSDLHPSRFIPEVFVILVVEQAKEEEVLPVVVD